MQSIMKSSFLKSSKGFTLIELLVVMAIIAIMMTMAASVLRDPGSGRTLDSGVDMLTSLIQEARATAQGNDTYTRLVIANTPGDNSRNSRHLRYVTVQIFRKTGTNRDTGNTRLHGEWVSTSSGAMLPAGIYFSPTFSTPLSWADGSGSRIATDTMRLSQNKRMNVYYFEFDEKGRYVSPSAGPSSPSQPFRIVLINARKSMTNREQNARDGIVPLQVDSRRRPMGAKGLVLWPNGLTSPLRTHDQIFSR